MSRHQTLPMTVSLIIPTYNRAHMITAAIRSALAQTRVPDEIVVVDDGSTDNTVEVLEQFAPLVRIVRQPNRGRSSARNNGIRNAKGDAVLFLDSDDMLMPRAVEACVAVLERRPEIDVVYGDAELVDVHGNFLCKYSDRMTGERPVGNILGELGRRCCLTMVTMVRKTALVGVAFEEGMEFGEDYDFWRQLAARSHFAYVDEPLMRYRIHPGMTVTSNPIKTLDSELEVQRRVHAMPEFACLPRRVRAMAYSSHGAKQAMRDRGRLARAMFWKAIVTDPTSLTPYALLGLSLFGLRPLQYAILKRRKMMGDNIAIEAGNKAIAQQRAVPAEDASDHDMAEVEEHIYG